MTFEEFAKNQTNIKAVLYDFIIIGEATRNVPKEMGASHLCNEHKYLVEK
jgi:uncharacterized protein with HEPN domain